MTDALTDTGITPLYGEARRNSRRSSLSLVADERTPLLSNTSQIAPPTQRSMIIALPQYLDDKLKEEVLKGLILRRDWQELVKWSVLGMIGIGSSGPSWVPNYELAGGGAAGVALVITGAVSYGAFVSLALEALREAIVARTDKVNAQEGNSDKGASSGIRYAFFLVILAGLISSAAAFQSFKLNHGAIAYLSSAIDFFTNTLTNSFSLDKLLKAPTTRISAQILLQSLRNPRETVTFITDGKQSKNEINKFLKECKLSEDEMYALQYQNRNVTAAMIGDVIFNQGKELSNKLKENCFGLYENLTTVPTLLALMLASFSGYYYWLAGCEVWTAIFDFFGAELYAVVATMAAVLAFFPAYLEFTLVSENLHSVFAAISDPHYLRDTAIGFIHKDSTQMKETSLLFNYSKTLWVSFKVLLLATFFAWGHRAQALSKMDELSDTWKEIVIVMNVINNMCYKSRSMWKLTDTIGIGIVKRFAEESLELTAQCIEALRQLTGVIQDLDILEIREFVKEWGVKFTALELSITSTNIASRPSDIVLVEAPVQKPRAMRKLT